MTAAIEPGEVFEHFLEAISQQRWEELPSLYADDAVVEHPFAAGPSRRLEGREALRGHFDALQDMGLQMRATNVVVHQTLDPEVIVAEFTYQGNLIKTGQPISRRNIFVTTVRNGLIINSRDYQGDA